MNDLTSMTSECEKVTKLNEKLLKENAYLKKKVDLLS